MPKKTGWHRRFEDPILLPGGGELLTLITGAGAERAIAVELARRARQTLNGLEVEILDGGQRRYLLLVGLE